MRGGDLPNLNPSELLHLAKSNEGNVVITGLSNAESVALIKTALRNLPNDFAAIVFDTTQDFREACDKYGVFSVDTTTIDPLTVVDIIEEALETAYRTYSSLIWTPAMAELTIRALQAGVPLAKLAERVKEFADEHELSTSINVARRARYFQYPHFDSNAALPPRLEPKRGVVTCVDLNNMNRVARAAYMLLAPCMLEYRTNIFYIIDNIQLLRTRRALITEYMRRSRYNMQFFVLIVENEHDIKRIENYAKIFIQGRVDS